MIAEVRGAIAAACAARLPDAQCTAYVLANPTPPSLAVFPAGTEYDKAMAAYSAMGVRSGTDMLAFTIRAFVGTLTDQGAQVLLDRMLEPSGGISIKEAVELDGTLGGLVDDCSITSVSGYTQYQTENSGVLLGAEWTVQVLAG